MSVWLLLFSNVFSYYYLTIIILGFDFNFKPQSLRPDYFMCGLIVSPILLFNYGRWDSNHFMWYFNMF